MSDTDEVRYLHGKTLEGTAAFFKVHKSASWSVYCDDRASGEFSVDGYIYRLRDGRWVRQIKRRSLSLQLYGIPEADPPDQIHEITIETAASLLADSRRATPRHEPPLPPDLVSYYEAGIDQRPDIADREVVSSGSPLSASSSHGEDCGIDSYETIDDYPRSFEPDKAEAWTPSSIT